MADGRMPWGKYKDRPLNEIPARYLRYVWRSRRALSPEIRRQIRDILGEAVGAGEPAPFRPRTAADWSALLRRWHREMCLRFHPDRGGSQEAMQALNVAYERLLQLIGE
jgi:hypothetical protein